MGDVTDFDVPLTRREAVVQRLRTEILSGELPPGALLKDAELARRLGVSITPVREALAQLAAEGLVDISPNRTRKVAGLSQKTALELVDVMELLACAGFEAGVQNLNDGHLACLQTRFAEYLAAVDRGDVTAAQAAGADFSTIVILAGGNRELQLLVDQVVTRTSRMLAVSTKSTIWAPWTEGYREVLALLEKGDRSSAAARYRQIFVGFRAAVEDMLWPSQPHPASTG
jgi:DNA-binding GntR family transcriptional regulator